LCFLIQIHGYERYRVCGLGCEVCGMRSKVPELVEGSLSKGAWFVCLTQSREGCAKNAKKRISPRNSTLSATPWFPLSYPVKSHRCTDDLRLRLEFLTAKSAMEAQCTQRNQQLCATPRSPRLRGSLFRKAAANLLY
jgi:hypothetical protein